jgi:ankyrin repeat protein
MNKEITQISTGLILALMLFSPIDIAYAAAPTITTEVSPNATVQVIAKSKASNPNLNAQLLNAAKNGDLQTLRSLISQATDVNVRDQYGWTPLLWAAMNGNTEMVRVLLVSGANPNTRNKYQWTPLMWAAGQGYGEIVRSLLSFGARINAQDRNGWTAMMWAVDGNHREVVAILAAKN